MLPMSYDLAVWEGDRPANDIAAAAQFRVLFETYVESGAPAISLRFPGKPYTA